MSIGLNENNISEEIELEVKKYLYMKRFNNLYYLGFALLASFILYAVIKGIVNGRPVFLFSVWMTGLILGIILKYFRDSLRRMLHALSGNKAMEVKDFNQFDSLIYMFILSAYLRRVVFYSVFALCFIVLLVLCFATKDILIIKVSVISSMLMSIFPLFVVNYSATYYKMIKHLLEKNK